MKYLIVDAYLNGTGIRDKYEGGYIDPHALNLSSDFLKRLSNWMEKYQIEFFNQYDNHSQIEILDKEGKEIATLLKKELGDDNSKIEYYSDAKMKSEIILST
jgi:hypothetical protein